jgi:hypothetical protein
MNSIIINKKLLIGENPLNKKLIVVDSLDFFIGYDLRPT